MRTLPLPDTGVRGGIARRGFPAGFLLFVVFVLLHVMVGACWDQPGE